MCIAPLPHPDPDDVPTADVPTMPASRVGPCDFRARTDRAPLAHRPQENPGARQKRRRSLLWDVVVVLIVVAAAYVIASGLTGSAFGVISEKVGGAGR
jgi:hypothetical protein